MIDIYSEDVNFLLGIIYTVAIIAIAYGFFFVGWMIGKQSLTVDQAWHTIIDKSYPDWRGHIHKAKKQKFNVLYAREAAEQISDRIDQSSLIGVQSTMGGPFQTINSIEYNEETKVIVINVSPSYCDW